MHKMIIRKRNLCPEHMALDINRLPDWRKTEAKHWRLVDTTTCDYCDEIRDLMRSAIAWNAPMGPGELETSAADTSDCGCPMTGCPATSQRWPTL
jgi:hypothetical protein